MENIKSRSILLGIATLLVMILISSWIKYHDVKKNEGIDNIEASYHSLLISKSLNEGRITEHHFLPIVTQGGDENKNIPWGAAVRDKSGGYIYTSFPSLGFLVPAAVIKSLSSDYTVLNLSLINLVILAATALIFYFLLIYIFKPNKSLDAVLVALACSPLILSRESLASTGLLYWPQSLSQLFIATFLLSSCKVQNANNNAWIIVAGSSIYLLAMTEWTGYVIGGLSAIYFILNKSRRNIRLGITLISSLSIAAITYLFQLHLTLDLKEFFSSSVARFLVRSGGGADFKSLFLGYYQSFAFFLITLPVFFLSKLFNKNRSNDTFNLLILLSSFSLLENIILAQHATSYTFDRLKLSFMISAMICNLVLAHKGKQVLIYMIFIIYSCLMSFNSYRADVKQFQGWSDIQRANTVIANKIIDTKGFYCASIYNNTRVRAYLNLLIGRSIWERLPNDNELHVSGECPVIVITGDIPFKDLQRVTSVNIYRNGKLEEVIE